MSHDDIQRLQARTKDEAADYILRDDLPLAWSVLSHLQGGRVDFVLDNAGFELYTDLVFADWLLETGIAREIVLQCAPHLRFS